MERPDIEAALERANKARKAPWIVWSDEGPIWLPTGDCVGGWTMSVCSAPGGSTSDVEHVCIATVLEKAENDPQGDANAAFIAAARTDVPALAEYALHMEAQNFALRVELEDLQRNRDAWQARAFERATPLPGQGGSVTIGLQVNGKMMFTIVIPVNATEAEIRDIILRDDRIDPYLTTSERIRWAYQPHKLMNCVVDPSGVP